MTQSIHPAYTHDGLKSPWETISTSRVWRHTIGRISCAIRVPFYALATLAQTGKTIVKAVVATITLGQLHRLGVNGHKFTFQAVARDAVGILSLVDRTANSVICSVCAPPKEYRSLAKALSKSAELVFSDNYHTHGEQEVKVSELFEGFRKQRSQYQFQITQCDCAASDKIVTQALRDTVKAG